MGSEGFVSQILRAPLVSIHLHRVCVGGIVTLPCGRTLDPCHAGCVLTAFLLCAIADLRRAPTGRLCILPCGGTLDPGHAGTWVLEARVRSQGPLDCVIFAFLVLVISFGATTRFGALVAASEDHRAKGVRDGRSVKISNEFGRQSARGVVTE